MFDKFPDIPEAADSVNIDSKKVDGKKINKRLKKINKKLDKVLDGAYERNQSNTVGEGENKSKETRKPSLLYKLAEGIVKAVPTILAAIVPMVFSCILNMNPINNGRRYRRSKAAV